jgi:hypothetical protein
LIRQFHEAHAGGNSVRLQVFAECGIRRGCKARETKHSPIIARHCSCAIYRAITLSATNHAMRNAQDAVNALLAYAEATTDGRG